MYRKNLCENIVNQTKLVIDILGINCKVLLASDIESSFLYPQDWSSFDTVKKNRFRNERLINILKFLSCSTYISGPAAKSYIDEKLLESKISVKWNCFRQDPKDNILSIVHHILDEGSREY